MPNQQSGSRGQQGQGNKGQQSGDTSKRGLRRWMTTSSAISPRRAVKRPAATSRMIRSARPKPAKKADSPRVVVMVAAAIGAAARNRTHMFKYGRPFGLPMAAPGAGFTM